MSQHMVQREPKCDNSRNTLISTVIFSSYDAGNKNHPHNFLNHMLKKPVYMCKKPRCSFALRIEKRDKASPAFPLTLYFADFISCPF